MKEKKTLSVKTRWPLFLFIFLFLGVFVIGSGNGGVLIIEIGSFHALLQTCRIISNNYKITHSIY